MAVISKTYPFNLSEQDLKNQIQDLVQDFINSNTKEEILNLDPQKQALMISLGQTELQALINEKTNKEIIALKDLIDKDSKSSQRLSHASFWVSVISIIIAVTTTAYYAYKSEKFEKEWATNEIELIEKLNSTNSENGSQLKRVNEQIWLLRQKLK